MARKETMGTKPDKLKGIRNEESPKKKSRDDGKIDSEMRSLFYGRSIDDVKTEVIYSEQHIRRLNLERAQLVGAQSRLVQRQSSWDENDRREVIYVVERLKRLSNEIAECVARIEEGHILLRS